MSQAGGLVALRRIKRPELKAQKCLPVAVQDFDQPRVISVLTGAPSRQ